MAHVHQYTLARLVLVAFKSSMQNLRRVLWGRRKKSDGWRFTCVGWVLGWWEEKHCTIALHNSTDTHYISQSGNTREVRTQENEQQRFMPFLYSMPFGSSRLPSCVQRVRERRGRGRKRENAYNRPTLVYNRPTCCLCCYTETTTQGQLRRDIPAVEIVDPHKTCLCSITLLGIVSVTKNKK